MDDSLVYEAWINSWSHAFLVHKTGKGQTCKLQQLELKVPTKNHALLFEQRLLVENASFLRAAMAGEIRSVPCKKGICEVAPVTEGGDESAWFWGRLVLSAFSQPTDPSYIVQSREEWSAALFLLTQAIAIPKKLLKHTKLSLSELILNCVRILEYAVFKANDFDCFALLKAISAQMKTSPDVEDSVLRKLSKVSVAVSTNSSIIAKLMSDDSICDQIQNRLAQDLYELWRTQRVTGAACAEKLIHFLGSSKANNCVILDTLRQLAMAGHAPSLARTPQVMDYLKVVAENELGEYRERYNSTLLLTELFPRYAWDVINVIIPNLQSAKDISPFILASFSLHDVPKLLSLIPDTNELICEDESCMSLTASRAVECSAAEVMTIIEYAEKRLAEHGAISLSWIALILAIIVGSGQLLNEDSLVTISEILRGQDPRVIVNLIRYWAVTIARHFNKSLRNQEIELTIIKEGPEIQYPPNPDNPLLHIALECCKRWRERVPRAVKALEERLLHKSVSSVFESTYIAEMDIARATSSNTEEEWFRRDIVNADDFLNFLQECTEFFTMRDITPFKDLDTQTIHQAFKKLSSGWNHLIHSKEQDIGGMDDGNESVNPDRSRGGVAVFELHVEKVVEVYLAGLRKLNQIISHLGQSMQCDDGGAESIYNSLEKCSQLQRFLQTCISICTECAYRVPHHHRSLINYLWFDQQLCPLFHTTKYLFKASLWFYSDPRAPLPLKLGLAQGYAQFMEYTPKTFKTARLPPIPVKDIVRIIKSNHACVVKQLQTRNVVIVSSENTREERPDNYESTRFVEEQDYYRDVADFIVAAIG